MFDRRNLVLSIILALPWLALFVVGTVATWQLGWWSSLVWLFPACWLLSWLLGLIWSPGIRRGKAMPVEMATHWTDRDREAADVIQRFQLEQQQIDATKLASPDQYFSAAEELAARLAKHYGHGDLTTEGTAEQRRRRLADGQTVLEVVAAVRLAITDVEDTLLKIPAADTLTIGRWKQLASATTLANKSYRTAWFASVLFRPLNLIRYAVSQGASARIWNRVKQETVFALYLQFIRQLGFYLIEMHSGRLAAGSRIYEESLKRPLAYESDPTEQRQTAEPSITISVIGQVSSGKSSLINSLLGKSEATVDLLPSTTSVQSYQVRLDGTNGSLTLLDTVGYEQDGASEQVLDDCLAAMKESDLILLVLNAAMPALHSDREMIQQLHAEFQSSRELHCPDVLGVLTHVDLLPPAREWSPPYNADLPTEKKEESIADAVSYAREVLGESLVDVIPVCSRENANWNVESGLTESMIGRLGQAKLVALVRAFERSKPTVGLRGQLSRAGELAGLLGRIVTSRLDGPRAGE